MANRANGVLYTGVTSDLVRRVLEHRARKHPGSFTARYNVFLLVYYEHFDRIVAAIDREKQIKAGSRKAKIKLIESMNPGWKDLHAGLL